MMLAGESRTAHQCATRRLPACRRGDGRPRGRGDGGLEAAAGSLRRGSRAKMGPTRPSFQTFRDRREAGIALARALVHLRGEEPVVLGLPRGGVPVAAEVARVLGAPLDVFVVRKLGVPGHEELAMGAVASGGAMVLNRGVLETLATMGMTQADLDLV